VRARETTAVKSLYGGRASKDAPQGNDGRPFYSVGLVA
jgi:hypothetical protein